jgi:hypothetical protein
MLTVWASVMSENNWPNLNLVGVYSIPNSEYPSFSPAIGQRRDRTY